MDNFHIYLYGPACGPIESTFEDAAARLEKLERVSFEPDGSFVCARNGGSEQVFGMLFDAANQLQYVEIRGNCQRETWRELVAAVCGGEKHDLAVMTLPGRQLQDLQSFEESAF